MTSGLFLKSKELKFVIEIKKNTPTEIIGNETFFHHALTNLVHNSVCVEMISTNCSSQSLPRLERLLFQ
jgi:hypothetical protein